MLILKSFLRQSVRFQKSIGFHRSLRSLTSFKADNLKVTQCKDSEKKPKPDTSSLLFGQAFTDHMLEIPWDEDRGWSDPIISPLHDFQLHPAAKVFHYAQELFEGMKAYRGVDGHIRLFRPELNMDRMLKSAIRGSLPAFDKPELLKCLKQLVALDADWVPEGEGTALYIRPTFIGIEPSLGVSAAKNCLLYVILSPVSSYFKTGFRPVSLLANPAHVRAWPGGVGDRKLGSNYGPTIAVQKESEKKGFQQVLWLFGDDHQLTEVGTMNIFVYLINEQGEKELITPPLNDGLILPGITRISLLEMSRSWNEFKVSERRITMGEVSKALDDGRLLEIFGSGTACVVCPVGLIHFQNRDLHIPTMDQTEPLTLRFLKSLSAIFYGKESHPWADVVC